MDDDLREMKTELVTPQNVILKGNIITIRTIPANCNRVVNAKYKNFLTRNVIQVGT